VSITRSPTSGRPRVCARSCQAPVASSDDPGGHHPGVVHDEEVARPQDLRQVADVPVGDRPIATAHVQQPRVGAAFERFLGDEIRGQVVVVEIGVGHAVHRNRRAGRSISAGRMTRDPGRGAAAGAMVVAVRKVLVLQPTA
jgi:hypothetical protein